MRYPRCVCQHKVQLVGTERHRAAGIAEEPFPLPAARAMAIACWLAAHSTWTPSGTRGQLCLRAAPSTAMAAVTSGPGHTVYGTSCMFSTIRASWGKDWKRTSLHCTNTASSLLYTVHYDTQVVRAWGVFK